jgi:hypothetical protein
MTFPELTRGSVINYPFLWSREAVDGETEGRKERETVLAARFDYDGKAQVALIPITASPPAAKQIAYELPETEVRRLSRRAKVRLWVILSEVNFDIVGESFYLSPDCKIAELSPRVFAQIWKAFVAELPTANKVRRYD